MSSKVIFKEMTWTSIQERARRCNIAIIPLGSMEPQAANLPVGTDTYLVEGLAQRGAALVADEVGAVVLPAFDFGSPVGPALLPEALNLHWEVLLEMLIGIFADLYRQGFQRFVLINGHGSAGIIQPPVQQTDVVDDGKPRMGGEGYSYQTSFGFAYDAAAQFVENGPDVEFFFISIGGFFRGALPAAQTSWWQGGGEGDLPLQVKLSLMLTLHPALIDLEQIKASRINGMLTSKYRFLGDPRYGVGAAFHHSHFGAASSQADDLLSDVSAEVGEQLANLWAQKLAVVLREMQAKTHLSGRYRPDAYKSGQPQSQQ
ncbi:MAG: creatininase family protein [Anaerolineae bacterium]|nr:creatininase family protein [Anaerolineae bacterium]